MYINISSKFHRIPDTQSHFKTKVHDLLGHPSYSINTFFYYLNIDFFGRAKSKIIDKEQTEKSKTTSTIIHIRPVNVIKRSA